MIKFKSITIKNFLSIGNVTQAIDFDRTDLTLVLGANLDLGGDDSGSRNGVGKTAFLNALSYGLYGQALTSIKKDNLINRTNAKGMVVTVDFEIGNMHYRVERGRRPTFLKFYTNDVLKEGAEEDDSQGDSRETQLEIERVLGLSHDMFKHIVALNTYTEPFLTLKAADQRTIIEQLLGITLLSEKAEKLKEIIRVTRDSVIQEQHKLKANEDANKRVKEQIESLLRRQKLWNNNWEEEKIRLGRAIGDLTDIDIEQEIQAHKDLEENNKRQRAVDDLNRFIASCRKDKERLEKRITELKNEIEQIENHKCYACGQKIHDEKQDSILTTKQNSLQETSLQWLSTDTQENEHLQALADLREVKQVPKMFYDTLEDALNHRSSSEALMKQLENKEAERDPYVEQIEEMQNQALVAISYNDLNQLNAILEHQEFLLKLLTNKDSFVRKHIIDQNLAHLNSRLSYYLEQIGLPHTVIFLNDLNVEISELGRELDFGNLSRGERNRLIISLSLAFRDVYENLNGNINLLAIDEMIDNGLDSSGVDSALAILKKLARDGNKSVWLISHRDELMSRVHNILRVVKENGYTHYSNSVDVV
jgi:DNA repair exonuclease SbcCD ATPase subunit